MTDFNNEQSIFTQIAELMAEKILSKEWKSNERILSVRDLANNLNVNPNTVMRAFAMLQNENVIYNQRGIGYFVSEKAIEILTIKKKGKFITNHLKSLIKESKLLGLELKEIIELIKNKYNEK